MRAGIYLVKFPWGWAVYPRNKLAVVTNGSVDYIHMAMTVDASEELREFFAVLAREQFPDAAPEVVRVDEDCDADGDPIYRIYVVFQTAKDLEHAKTLGFVRRVAPKLEERKDFHFPLFSFMTKADAKKILAAA